jgi:L-threonylcarbamoyladenylate synthase
MAEQAIRAGQCVAFPTETVYGLGANALDEQAVAGIFVAKGRPADNPLIVHVADIEQLDLFVEQVSELERQLMATFWPGPLTFVLPAKTELVPANVRAQLPTVAVRMPAHPVAQALIRTCGCPLAAPSANRSGRPSPTKAAHVFEDLQGRIAGIVDGGVAGLGIESTVIRCMPDGIHILRPGSVTAQQLQTVVAGVEIRASYLQAAENVAAVSGTIPVSPGLKYAHYAPKGIMIVVDSAEDEVRQTWLAQQMAAARREGHKTGLLTFTNRVTPENLADVIFYLGTAEQPEVMAQSLYDCLRSFDRQHVSYIVAEACAPGGVGSAVLNRLLKAASERFVKL